MCRPFGKEEPRPSTCRSRPNPCAGRQRNSPAAGRFIICPTPPPHRARPCLAAKLPQHAPPVPGACSRSVPTQSWLFLQRHAPPLASLVPSRPPPPPHSYRPNRGIKRGGPAMGTFLRSSLSSSASAPPASAPDQLAPAAPPAGAHGTPQVLLPCPPGSFFLLVARQWPLVRFRFLLLRLGKTSGYGSLLSVSSPGMFVANKFSHCGPGGRTG
jgi:hypothetical protein